MTTSTLVFAFLAGILVGALLTVILGFLFLAGTMTSGGY